MPNIPKTIKLKNIHYNATIYTFVPSNYVVILIYN